MYRIDDKREYVKEIQLALNLLGYGDSHLVPIDGVYGENTKLAVLHFQEKNQIPTTGYINYETHLTLMKQRDSIAEENSFFPIKMGDKNERVRQVHSGLNTVFSGNQNGQIPIEGDLFTEQTSEYVNLFLARIGEEPNGQMNYEQFERLMLESEISLLYSVKG